MNRVFTIIGLVAIVAIPLRMGYCLWFDFQHPELWDDFNHDPRIYLPITGVAVLGGIVIWAMWKK